MTLVGRSRGRIPSLRLHRTETLLAADRTKREGIPVTSVSRTLLDVAEVVSLAQLRRFADATAGCPGERSIANSAGILAWPDARSEWARPGLMLYGIVPFRGESGADFGLSPVMSFETEVIAEKTVLPGESVGYCATWHAGRPSRIAIAAAGYGDGYPRATATGAPVLIDGRRAPLVGRVSMDMLAVDVTDLPTVRPGDRVTLWGDGLPVEEVARYAGAIPYELTCSVSPRVLHEVR